MERICKRFLITGKVQGVFYRDSSCKKALELDLTGWVRNLTDGRVELLACGDVQRVNELEKWLWEGPKEASVSGVESQEQPVEEHRGFKILCAPRG